MGAEPPLPWQKLDLCAAAEGGRHGLHPRRRVYPWAHPAEAAEHERSCLLEAPERCEKDYYARQINDRSVLVPTFHLDQFEVSNAQFARYLNAALKNRLAKVEGIFVYLERRRPQRSKSGGALVYEGAGSWCGPGRSGGRWATSRGTAHRATVGDAARTCPPRPSGSTQPAAATSGLPLGG